MLESLATEEDVREIITLFHEYFTRPVLEDTPALDQQHPILVVPFRGSNTSGDLGVEVESGMTPSQLSHNLGFASGLPFLFNSYRHTSGLNCWSSSLATTLTSPDIATNPLFTPLSLHWHQLAGVHAIIRMNFTSLENPSGCCGTLITDEVGLGKTFQATATLAFLSEVRIRQTTGQPLPPIIGKSFYECS